MLATKIEDAKREEGFTLIELLVVVIIIGILAAIAIPVFLNQRTSARESAVESTLRSAATYMEIVLTDTNAYPATVVELETEGFRQGAVTVSDPTVVGETYTIEGQHTEDALVIFCFDSEVGVAAPGAC